MTLQQVLDVLHSATCAFRVAAEEAATQGVIERSQYYETSSHVHKIWEAVHKAIAIEEEKKKSPPG